jgi:hypothetical protein
LDANQAVSFFAHIWDKNPNLSHVAANVQSISLANDKTKEKLVIEGIGPYLGEVVTILRYPMGAEKECIEEEMWKIIIMDATHRQERKIEVNISIR